MKVEEYFSGPIKAWGLIQNRFGKVTRRFEIDMNGTWDGDTGTLDEHYEYSDGVKEHRVWTIKKVSENNYEGYADDLVNKAVGLTEESDVKWSYIMDVDVGKKTYSISFDDRMYLMNNGVVINRSYLKKFGFRVAELTIFMQKQS
ncbi:MAG: hypothetical protein CBB87_04640 [Micavibrio sp. TMED27]|nr:MAG: hypothetical protein CBB87_04640 [Micavibrio sp. TMED27]|tara:strand:- start:5133 stop:5567 length:435 start_codon:yes stop_codon:yes gene_type:complete